MPLRNMWSLNPGEVLVAEEILKNVPRCELYFPVHDVGIDLLVVKGKQYCGIQVKESRYFPGRSQSIREHSWHQVKGKNLNPDAPSNRKMPDIFVFLTYLPNYEPTKISSFRQSYIIIPLENLRTKMGAKRPSRGVYSFYFCFEGKQVSEIRDGPEDYSEFLDNWDLVDQALSQPSGLVPARHLTSGGIL